MPTVATDLFFFYHLTQSCQIHQKKVRDEKLYCRDITCFVYAAVESILNVLSAGFKFLLFRTEFQATIDHVLVSKI